MNPGAIGADAAGTHFLGDALGKRDEAGFRCCIVGLAGVAVYADNGCHVDD